MVERKDPLMFLNTQRRMSCQCSCPWAVERASQSNLLLPILQSERFGKHFASFGREAAMLADLNHPNVLRFYGVVTENATDNTVIGIMTEYIRGGSLSGFLRWGSRSLLLTCHSWCQVTTGAKSVVLSN